MGYDKKRTEAGLRWVLPRGRAGRWRVEWDVAASPEAVRAAVKEIGETP
jgi:hypothetical protein